jgi:DNA-binding NarL/FixJ family response regulator
MSRRPIRLADDHPIVVKGSPCLLTDRQREVLRLLVEGCSAKQIADRLGISKRTVEFHKAEMREALSVNTTAELIVLAVQHGLGTTAG